MSRGGITTTSITLSGSLLAERFLHKRSNAGRRGWVTEQNQWQKHQEQMKLVGFTHPMFRSSLIQSPRI